MFSFLFVSILSIFHAHQTNSGYNSQQECQSSVSAISSTDRNEYLIPFPHFQTARCTAPHPRLLPSEPCCGRGAILSGSQWTSRCLVQIVWSRCQHLLLSHCMRWKKIKKKNKKTFVTCKNVFNWNRKLAQGKEKPPKPNCKKDSEFWEYEADQEL